MLLLYFFPHTGNFRNTFFNSVTKSFNEVIKTRSYTVKIGWFRERKKKYCCISQVKNNIKCTAKPDFCSSFKIPYLNQSSMYVRKETKFDCNEYSVNYNN